ncbi:MAG: CoA transferase [Chloroflexota bacterium]|nr:CoA transferase [Chloroflexota bacterium]
MEKHRGLSNLKIVEYANFITGPFCTKLMADLGAEVIKIEKPGTGEESRKRGPFLNGIPHPEKSGLFLHLNTNKLGMTLNLNSHRGSRIFKELIKDTDILVENNPPSKMKSQGLDYASLREINPRLIMTSITPFGQTGPYRDYKGCDLISAHMSGLAYVTPGRIKDPEREPPLKTAGKQTDFMTGLIGALLTMSAVFTRKLTGTGQHIDLSEYEATATALARDISLFVYGYEKPSRAELGLHATAGHLACRDGYLQFHVLGPLHWNAFLDVIGNPEWGQDDRFRDHASRVQNWDVLKPLIEEWTRERNKEDIFQIMQQNRVPITPVNTIDDVVNSLHLADRWFFVDIDRPQTGTLKYPGAPVKFSQDMWSIKNPTPQLGEHNEPIICQRLGYSRDDLVRMQGLGVI